MMDKNIETRLIISAIHKIRPDAGFSIDKDYETLQWLCEDQEKPTEQEFNNAVEIEKAEYNAQEYSRKREAEYPSIQECVHAILDDDLDALQTKRAEIKKKYPKG